jgi:hypothetical protein
MTLADEIELAVCRAIRPLNAKLARMEKLWTEMLVKRPNQKVLAKRAGVSPSTLWRRRRRAEMNQRLGAV